MRTARIGSSSCASGGAEDRHHRVAHQLLDAALVALDDGRGVFEDAGHESARLFRIEALGERGIAGEVRKEHRDLPARTR